MKQCFQGVLNVAEARMWNGSSWVVVTDEDHRSATDPHLLYLTEVRGDARYYTEPESDALLAGKANTSSLAAVAASGLYADLSGMVPTSALPALSSSGVLNAPTMAGGILTVTVTSNYGVTPDGVAYYDPDGAVAADAAIASLSPSGALVLTRPGG